MLDAARAGSEVALNGLTDSCRPYLLAIANKELTSDLRQKVNPSDIVQETLMSMCRDIERFNGTTRKDLLAWLRGFVVNDLRETRRTYRTAKRQLSREASLDGISPEPRCAYHGPPTPSTEASTREQALLLRDALLQLPEDKRRVIRLRTWEGLSFHEIGQQMDRTPEAARKLWSRAISSLTQLITNDEGLSCDSLDTDGLGLRSSQRNR